MKKLSILLLSLGISILTYAQPVADNATIPVSVTLNSILRLNVTAGGNIEFAVNTLAQYTDGIANSAATTTRFTVASSVDFVVSMYAETADLGSNDLAAGSTNMALDNIGYSVATNGTGVQPGNYTIPAFDAAGVPQEVLTQATTEIITGVTQQSAGDISKNDFSIAWELATAAVTSAGSGSGSLLSQNLASDRYSTNVFLVLSKLP
jgi:hypothetical protein